MIKILSLLIIVTLTKDGLSSITCLNRNGKPVDWFVGYKMPHLNYHSSDGLNFLYADEVTHWDKFENINSTDSAVGQTLAQYYKARDDEKTFYTFYNDELPESLGGSNSICAHAKGGAVFDDTTGFWLIHSVPKFPKPDFYEYSPNGIRYGQSFLCITMKLESLEAFAEQITMMEPQIYKYQIPDKFLQRFPELKNLIPQKYRPKHDKTSSVLQIKTPGGVSFTSFSKGPKFGKDLYADLIAPSLKASLNVETWMNGGGDLPSECESAQKIKNVKKLQINGIKFPNSHDHSKWAIGETSTTPIVCIGDINRQNSQKRRGGGSACFVNHDIWSLYDSSVVELESCEEKKPKSFFNNINNRIQSILEK